MGKMKELEIAANELIRSYEEMESFYKKADVAREKFIDAMKRFKDCFCSDKKEEPTPETAPDVDETKLQQNAKTYSFIEVRGIMAELAGKGKRAEVKALITKYGAEKLSDVNPDDYLSLVKEAEEIANG